MYIGRSVMLVLCVVVSASTAGAFGSRDRISRSRDRSGWHRPGSRDRDRSSSSSSTSRTDRTSRRDAPTRSSTSPTPKPTPAPPPGNGFGGSLPGLTAEQLARFDAGRDAFEEVETAADGLGPVFNDTSCVACHDGGATG